MALDYLPSPSWAVIYGETPSADRWSELGENDDALATAAGIDDLAIINRHLGPGAVTADKAALAAGQEAWIAPSLLNGWQNYEVTPTNFPGAGYYKDSLGIVHCRGLIKGGTTTTNTDLFIFPAGYRPQYDMHIPVISNGALCTLRVEQDGGVEISAGASTSWIDLMNIQFRAV